MWQTEKKYKLIHWHFNWKMLFFMFQMFHFKRNYEVVLSFFFESLRRLIFIEFSKAIMHKITVISIENAAFPFPISRNLFNLLSNAFYHSFSHAFSTDNILNFMTEISCQPLSKFTFDLKNTILI